ncbi:MAG TPA: amidohydrolase family protein, partial [Novosphingobium sp.]|nr:amidohydrolase family protein [Novosphingobium sp.]
AGALGFSTSRSLNHKGSDGRVSPSLQAAEAELTAIATALGQTGTGVLQGILDPADAVAEMEMFGRVCRAAGRPMSLSVMQRHSHPEAWREVMAIMDKFNAEGMTVRGQVSERPVGALYGLDLSFNPLAKAMHYASIADLPLPQRVKALAEPSLRARILAEMEPFAQDMHFDRMFSLGNPPDYEPGPDRFVAARARAQGVSALEMLYDLMLEDEGRAIIAHPASNYAYGSLEACREMMLHPHTVMGLGDGGAHLGILCDASQPTHLLSYWTRDRASGRIPVETAVSALSRETAAAVGLNDRGTIARGKRADINVIDYDKLAFDSPTATYDLPQGGRRLGQRSRGYAASLVAGTAIVRNDAHTGARPGRLVRGAR